MAKLIKNREVIEDSWTLLREAFPADVPPLGAVIILMLWFYVTGLAILLGGQINATIEHAAAEHGHIEAKAPGQKAA